MFGLTNLSLIMMQPGEIGCSGLLSINPGNKNVGLLTQELAPCLGMNCVAHAAATHPEPGSSQAGVFRRCCGGGIGSSLFFEFQFFFSFCCFSTTSISNDGFFLSFCCSCYFVVINLDDNGGGSYDQ